MRGEKKKLTTVPKTKNGPNGTSDFIPFFFHKISMIPISPPVKNATYKAIGACGNPSKSPIRKANFTSPKPIPRPLVRRNINKKKRKHPMPVKRFWKKRSGLINISHKNVATPIKMSTSSGIILNFRSAKKITMSEDTTDKLNNRLNKKFPPSDIELLSVNSKTKAKLTPVNNSIKGYW